MFHVRLVPPDGEVVDAVLGALPGVEDTIEYTDASGKTVVAAIEDVTWDSDAGLSLVRLRLGDTLPAGAHGSPAATVKVGDETVISPERSAGDGNDSR